MGLVEYGLKTIDLHCRVNGYFGKEKPAFCAYQPEAYKTGLNHTDGPIFSTMEHLGVHGFNVMLATGGAVVGLPEVAWETLYMSFATDPVDGGIVNASKRTNQCIGGSLKEHLTRQWRLDADFQTSASDDCQECQTGQQGDEGNPDAAKIGIYHGRQSWEQ